VEVVITGFIPIKGQLTISAYQRPKCQIFMSNTYKEGMKQQKQSIKKQKQGREQAERKIQEMLEKIRKGNDNAN
jgi:hypothetical protein